MSKETIAGAIGALRRGELVVLFDDLGSGQSDLVGAAENAAPEQMAFAVRHGSGFVCVALPEAWARKLALPPMVPDHEPGRYPVFAVAVDAAADVSTGISARDRAVTISRLADPASVPSDFHRPGHVVPIRVGPAESMTQGGSAAFALDLTAAAGRAPVAYLSTLISVDVPAAVACEHEARRFARQHGLVLISASHVYDHFQGASRRGAVSVQRA